MRVCLWANAHPSEALFERYRSMQVDTVEAENSQSRPCGRVHVDGDILYLLVRRLYEYGMVMIT